MVSAHFMFGTQTPRELADLTLDFSLEVTGFEMAEIDLFIEGAANTPQPDPDDVPVPVTTGPAVTRPGDTVVTPPAAPPAGTPR